MGTPGAIIADLYHHIIPLIPKNPKYIVIMIGTNDARNKTANEIMLEIKDLSYFIEIDKFADLLPKNTKKACWILSNTWSKRKNEDTKSKNNDLLKVANLSL